MTYWTNGSEMFEDEMDARDNVCSEMTWDDIENYFQRTMDFHEFFTRVRAMPNFFENFENEFCNAENDYFEQNYWVTEVEEESEITQ